MHARSHKEKAVMFSCIGSRFKSTFIDCGHVTQNSCLTFDRQHHLPTQLRVNNFININFMGVFFLL